ncbi:MAG: prepilin-type N-terminal cleavage/methylation domain-containing protein [Kiritimatiellae bacterium]|nr:prepilin-type N-terminal cleavage/methylation domain-containing protein [Kiritimatiellia bacterium]
MKRGFTLIELLVVIGILGLLMGTLTVVFFGSSEASRAAKCKANMKALWNGVSEYMMATKRYPLAGSVECSRYDGSRGSSKGVDRFYEIPGWISWNSQGAYCGNPTSHKSSQSWFTSAYNEDERVREFVITNGAIWAHSGRNRPTYICPEHTRAQKKSDPNWSYVMNAYFGWDFEMGSRETFTGGSNGHEPRLRPEDVKRADKILMFAELPFNTLTDKTPNVGTGSGIENDCVLQYKDCAKGIGEAESIGFNHKRGNDVVAHVIFTDGHTDEIVWRQGQDVEELTRLLCIGRDVQFNASSGKWEESK